LAALQAGVGPGEVADCAERYPLVFQAWLDATQKRADNDQLAESKSKSQELLAGLKSMLGRK
jgi:hypothetical protein